MPVGAGPFPPDLHNFPHDFIFVHVLARSAPARGRDVRRSAFGVRQNCRGETKIVKQFYRTEKFLVLSIPKKFLITASSELLGRKRTEYLDLDLSDYSFFDLRFILKEEAEADAAV